MLKKVIIFIMALVMIMTLTACVEKKKESENAVSDRSDYTASEALGKQNESSDVTTAVAVKEENVNSDITSTPKDITSTPKENKTESKITVSTEQTSSIPKNEPVESKREETVIEPESTPPKTIISETEVENKVAEYINDYRLAQGDNKATVLSGLTEVARYRAVEIQNDFLHDSDVCTVLKYGEYIDMTKFGGTVEDSYYRGYSKEAIGKGDLFGTAEQVANRIATGFKNSKAHWSYVGDSKYSYMAVGVKFNEQQNKWFCCICMSTENYGG